MAQSIRIKLGDLELSAELNDTSTAKAIADALPIQGSANVWGDEIYFAIPIHEREADDARDLLEVGELAYWPPGNAFCILFGSTPASTDERPRTASAVNPIGRLTEDVAPLRAVRSGTSVVIESA